MVWYEPDDSYFVIGGDTDVQYNSHPTDEVRRYSKKSGWSNITPLPERVRGAQAVSIHGRIYVIGNFSKIFFFNFNRPENGIILLYHFEKSCKVVTSLEYIRLTHCEIQIGKPKQP